MDKDAPDWISEALIAFSIFFSSFAFGATEEWSQGLLGLLAYALLWRVFSRNGVNALRRPIMSPAAVSALGLIALAYLQLLRPESVLALALGKGPFTVSSYLTRSYAQEWTSYAAILIAAPDVLRRNGALERLAWVLTSLGALLAIVGIVQQQAGNTHYLGIRAVSPLRVPFGPFPNKNHAGSFLAISTCSGLGLLASTFTCARGNRPRYPIDEAIGRILIIGTCIGLLLAGLFWARSRGAQLALALGFLCIPFLLSLGRGISHKKRLLSALPLLAVIFAGGLGAISRTSLMDLLRPDAQQSPAYRMTWIGEALRFSVDQPAFGIGLGAYRVVAPLLHSLVDNAYVVDYAHCDPVQLAVEGGIPTSLLVYGSLLWTLISAIRLREPLEADLRVLQSGFALAVATVLFHQLVDFPSRIMGVQLPFMLCLSAVWASTTPAALPRSPSKAAHIALAVALSTAWLPHFLPELRASYFDLMAARTIPPSTHYYRTAALETAPTFQRHLAMAVEYADSARENPSARTILLRKALAQTESALDFEPLQPNASRLKAALLRQLGRGSDAAELP